MGFPSSVTNVLCHSLERAVRSRLALAARWGRHPTIGRMERTGVTIWIIARMPEKRKDFADFQGGLHMT
jgi:hypothetical protein